MTEAPDSPHLLVPKMQADYLFAIAENDDSNDPEAKNVLRESFAGAGRSAEIEVYAGTLHGWCPPDSAVYHEAQAERAWSRLLALFKDCPRVGGCAAAFVRLARWWRWCAYPTA